MKRNQIVHEERDVILEMQNQKNKPGMDLNLIENFPVSFFDLTKMVQPDSDTVCIRTWTLSW